MNEPPPTPIGPRPGPSTNPTPTPQRSGSLVLLIVMAMILSLSFVWMNLFGPSQLRVDYALFRREVLKGNVAAVKFISLTQVQGFFKNLPPEVIEAKNRATVKAKSGNPLVGASGNPTAAEAAAKDASANSDLATNSDAATKSAARPRTKPKNQPIPLKHLRILHLPLTATQPNH